MKNFSLLLLFILLLLESCAHLPTRREPLSFDQKSELYARIAQEIKDVHAIHLKECNCMKAFFRNLFDAPNTTVRYAFDKMVGEYAPKKDHISVLAIGSGTLLNELTAFANILARGQSLHIYLTDWAYVFYGEPNFEKKALDFAENLEKIPVLWKNFPFWNYAKTKEEPYIPFFEKHHIAIDEFKSIIKRLDKIYGTTSSVTIIKPATDQPISLPLLDMIISIDAFLDVPNLIWNLYYQMKLNNDMVRFISLGKSKPLGGFWDAPDAASGEANSMHPVTIDVYNVRSSDVGGSYEFVERAKFEPTDDQIKKAPTFPASPNPDLTQSPFDIVGNR